MTERGPAWHIITSEYPPDVGGVSDYAQLVASALVAAGDVVHVWCPQRRSGARATPECGAQIHETLGRIRPSDLRRLDQRLDACPAPRRVLVQWVPHGFGYHSMNVAFCLWLAKRARAGDRIEVMVHEPYLAFEPGPLRHVGVAAVHRLMTMVLLGAASRVWISIPTWEARLRPYALMRRVPMTWLPIPASLPLHDGHGPAATSQPALVDSGRPLVGHVGTYGPAVAELLRARVPGIMDAPARPWLLLLGAGSHEFCRALIGGQPPWADRVQAMGHLPPAALSASIASCDVLVQPYPDGVSSRRTTAMAALAHARPLVSTRGHLTEPLWDETGAASLSDVADVAGFVADATRLLGDAEARRALGARGLAVYDARFALCHVVAALRAA